MRLNGDPEFGFSTIDFQKYNLEMKRNIEKDYLLIFGDIWLENMREELKHCREPHSFKM